jgi:hypothetical protein
MPRFNFNNKETVLDAIRKEGANFFDNNLSRAEFQVYLNDADFMLAVAKENNEVMQYAPIETARAILKTEGSLLKDASEEVKSDYVSIFNAVSSFVEAIEDANLNNLSELQKEDIYYEAVAKDWKMLARIDKKYATKNEFIELALKQDASAASLAGIDMQNIDGNLAMIMAKNSDKKLDKYNKELRQNYKFADLLIEKDPLNIKYVLGGLVKDISLASKAMFFSTKNNYKEVYKSLPKKMQTAEEIAAYYVSKEGDLKGLRKEVVYNSDVALVAVRAKGENLEFYKGTHIADDKKIVLEAVQNDPSALKYASRKLKKDEDIVNNAVLSVVNINNKTSLKKHPLNYASKSFRNNSIIMMAAVKTCGLSLNFASKKLKNSRTLVQAAIKQNAFAFEYASKALKKDVDIILLAVEANPGAAQLVNKNILESANNLGKVLKVVENRVDIYDVLPESLQKNKEVVLKVAKVKPDAVNNLSQRDRRDKTYMRQLAKVSKEAFEKGVSLKLLQDDKYMQDIKNVWEKQEAALETVQEKDEQNVVEQNKKEEVKGSKPNNEDNTNKTPQQEDMEP